MNKYQKGEIMDRLIEFLTTKVGYVLTVILGFIVPGNVLIFVWNRNMYLEIDIIKLLILSFSISFVTLIPNLIAVIAMNFIKGVNKSSNNKEETKFDILYNIGFSVGLVVIEMIFVIFMAICTENFQLKTYIMYAGLAITGIIIIYSAVMLLKQLIKKIRK